MHFLPFALTDFKMSGSQLLFPGNSLATATLLLKVSYSEILDEIETVSS